MSSELFHLVIIIISAPVSTLGLRETGVDATEICLGSFGAATRRRSSSSTIGGLRQLVSLPVRPVSGPGSEPEEHPVLFEAPDEQLIVYAIETKRIATHERTRSVYLGRSGLGIFLHLLRASQVGGSRHDAP